MEHFAKGTEFNTYKELLVAKNRYEQASKTLLITNKSKKYPLEDPRCADLVYARIKYECKAGQGRKSTSMGARAVSTGKMNCPVFVELNAKEGKFCVVNSMLNHANHTVDTDTFMKYPENLRLKPNEIRYAKELLAKGFNKKTIKDKLKEKRGGRPVAQKFWAQIDRAMKREDNLGSNQDDMKEDDFADEIFDAPVQCESNALLSEVKVKQEEFDTSGMDFNHDSSDDDDVNDGDGEVEGGNGSGDPLSDMFQKCDTDDNVSVNNRKNDKLKKDFDNWFKDLIPGEKLSYNEWLWQLEFNFPSLDKLNFIKYGIILGMTILNKFYFDGSMKIDGNGIREVGAEFQRKRKKLLRPMAVLNKEKRVLDEDDNDDDDFADNENDDFQHEDDDDDEPIDVVAEQTLIQGDVKPMANLTDQSPKVLKADDSSSTSAPKTTQFDSVKPTPTNSQPTDGPIKCKMCPQEFPTHSQLYHHSTKYHTAHIGLNCHICNKRFQYERNMNLHLVNVHGNNVPNCTNVEPGQSICEICGASFDKISSLRSHSRYVHSIEKFFCQYCNRKLSSKKSLREHIQFQHERSPLSRTSAKSVRESSNIKVRGGCT